MAVRALLLGHARGLQKDDERSESQRGLYLLLALAQCWRRAQRVSGLFRNSLTLRLSCRGDGNGEVNAKDRRAIQDDLPGSWLPKEVFSL